MAIYIASMLIIMFSHFTDLLGNVAGDLTSFAVAIATVALLVGVIVLFKYHIGLIARRAKDWQYSFVALGAFLIYFFGQYAGETISKFLLDNIYTPTSMVIFLMGVARIMMVWHGTRIRSIYSALLVGMLVITVLAKSALGPTMPALMGVGTWLETVPIGGLSRAFLILMGIGLFALVIRVLLGYETTYIGKR